VCKVSAGLPACLPAYLAGLFPGCLFALRVSGHGECKLGRKGEDEDHGRSFDDQDDVSINLRLT
jgi:hypothetical protein